MHMHSSEESNPVPVQLPILLLAALLVPVLLAAFYMIYLFPESIGADHFAWPMNPKMSSMMLGATYLGGAYFFLMVLLLRQWRYVWLGFLPITAFAGTLGIATLLHWNLFVHERWAFQFWAFLYFVVPFVLPVLWVRNQWPITPTNTAPDNALPSLSRWAFGALGIVLTVAGMLLLLAPQVMIATWPWTLSPLTARVMSAIFILPGLVGLGMAYDGRWSSARYLLQAQAVSIIFMLIAAYVARADFDWTAITSWLFVGGLILILLLIGYTYYERK